MIKLLLIADDFTGALDTGIQFAKYGAATRILTSSEIDDDLWRNDLTEVLVIDTETRHLSRQEAYRKIYCLVTKAIEMGVPHIYKKTNLKKSDNCFFLKLFFINFVGVLGWFWVNN